MDNPDPLKILILDDNPIDREICRRYLRRKNAAAYRFVEHNTIEGAGELVAREEPDCILLDYHLQDGTGVEFLEDLAGIGGTRKYPVVMLTGTGSETIAVQVMKAGAQDYLVKDSLNPDMLHRSVETAIYRAETERLLEDQRAEMERLFREAQEANMRKDQFLAALSHELRTPLTPVLAAISAADVVTADPGQLREIFGIIRRNIELEARLIDDLLDLTRISRGKLDVKLQPTDLDELLRHAADACEAERTAKNIRIDFHLDAVRPRLMADAARIQQVFWNLLKNAIKFTPQGGSVTVTTRHVGACVEVEITDTGIGLQPETEEKIFDAFVQGGSEVTRRFGGLGLGLAISKALVEAHDGSIRARNRTDGRGAVFRVSLPTGEPGRDASEAGSQPLTESRRSCGTSLLLVEDHADSAYFLKLILEGMNYRVFVADRVDAALALFRQEQIDILVSDLGLPDRSGTELMKEIRAIRPVPAIALSGYGMEADVQRSLEAGFTLHLTKPTDVQQLTEALHSLEPNGERGRPTSNRPDGQP